MNKDQSEDKYKEVFRQMKEEKMNWNFEDFLEDVKVGEKSRKERDAPLMLIFKGRNSLVPKGFLVAASLVLLVSAIYGVGLLIKTSDSKKQDLLVKSQIAIQKDAIFRDSVLAYQSVSDSLKGKKNQINIIEDSLSNEVSNPEKVMNQIVPKHGKLIKNRKERLAYAPVHGKQSLPAEYEDNFVIVNGHKIKNEEEAINVTKYSFQMLSNNVAKTIASSVVQENPVEN